MFIYKMISRCHLCIGFSYLPQQPMHQSVQCVRPTAFSCALILQELTVETDFAADSLFANVDHDACRHLSS